MPVGNRMALSGRIRVLHEKWIAYHLCMKIAIYNSASALYAVVFCVAVGVWFGSSYRPDSIDYNDENVVYGLGESLLVQCPGGNQLFMYRAQVLCELKERKMSKAALLKEQSIYRSAGVNPDRVRLRISAGDRQYVPVSSSFHSAHERLRVFLIPSS